MPENQPLIQDLTGFLDRRLYLVGIDGDEGTWSVGIRGKRRALEFAWRESEIAHGSAVVMRARKGIVKVEATYRNGRDA